MDQNSQTTTTFGLLPTEDRLVLNGMELFRGMLAGSVPHPPIAKILNFKLIEALDGLIVFQGTANPEFTNPMGTIHGGWYGTLLDSAMACAVMTKAQKGQQFTTLEYKVNLTRPFPVGEMASATGKIIHFGRKTATAEATISDKNGRKYAFGTTTCLAV